MKHTLFCILTGTLTAMVVGGHAWAQSPGMPRIQPTETSTPTPAIPSATDKAPKKAWSPPKVLGKPAPPKPPESTKAADCVAKVEKRYEEGFVKLSEQRYQDSIRLFDEVLHDCPSHPFASEMRRLAKEQVKVAGIQEDSEGGSWLARAEVIAFQTLHGIGQGIFICVAAECDNARVVAGLGIGGALLFGGASFWLSSGISSGSALAVNSGTGWGIWNGLALSIALDLDDGGPFGMISGVALGGTALGIVAAYLFDPSPSQVSLANTTGIWSGALAALAMLIHGEGSERAFFGVEMAVTNLGMIGGAIAGQFIDIGRGWLFVVDAGGVLGGLLGAGVALLIDNSPSRELVGGMAMTGMLGGLVGGYFITRAFKSDDSKDDSQVSVSPVLPVQHRTGPGAAYGLSLGMAF